MGNTVKITFDSTGHALLLWLFGRLRDVGGMVDCLELESLILMEFQRRHLGRLFFSKPPYVIKFRPHEALSYRRLLFAMDMPGEVSDAVRNQICDDVSRQLNGLC
jgi:hypothetical protein